MTEATKRSIFAGFTSSVAWVTRRKSVYTLGEKWDRYTNLGSKAKTPTKYLTNLWRKFPGE